MSSRFLLGALCAVVTITIWAGWLVVMRVGMASHLAVVDLIALRFAVAGIVMGPVVMRRGWALDHLRWTGFAAIVIVGGPFSPLPLPPPPPFPPPPPST